MKYIFVLSFMIALSCFNNNKAKEPVKSQINNENLVAILDTIWTTEQLPIRLRDSLMLQYGAESELVAERQVIIERKYVINEKKIKAILDEVGWPTKEMAGQQGNWTIYNVILHSDNEVRIDYLLMMNKL